MDNKVYYDKSLLERLKYLILRTVIYSPILYLRSFYDFEILSFHWLDEVSRLSIRPDLRQSWIYKIEDRPKNLSEPSNSHWLKQANGNQDTRENNKKWFLLFNTPYTLLFGQSFSMLPLNFLFIKMQERERDVVTLFTSLKEQTVFSPLIFYLSLYICISAP